MNRSPELNELAAALAVAQGIMEGAAKGKINPFLNTKYADLSSVWEACRGPLSSNGLSVVQVPLADVQGCVGVETTLLHKSGQWLSSAFYVPLIVKAAKDKNKEPTAGVAPATAQDVMAALTYARRGALSALVGIAPEDDDGESQRQRPAANTEQVRSAPAAVPDPAKTEARPPAAASLAAQIQAATTIDALSAVGAACKTAATAGAVTEAEYTTLVAAFAAQRKSILAPEKAA